MRAALCAFVLAAAGSAIGLGAASAAWATTAPPPYFKLSVTPTQDLTDGEQMTVTVTRTDAGKAAGLEITWVAFAWCTPTFTPPASPPTTRPSPPATSQFPTRWQLSGAHCTTVAHPLNGDILPKTIIAPQANSSGDYPTVTGHVPAQSSEGTKLYSPTTQTTTGFDLVCDPTHPCRFAVAVFTRHAGTQEQEPPIFLSTPVTFSTATTLSGCTGEAPGAVTSASPNMLGTAVTDWTIGACKAGIGGGAALTGNTGSDEGDSSALKSFANGTDDLAYSAVGYGADSSFAPSVNRPYVAVPVAIDAVVLGHVQTYAQPSPAAHEVLGSFPSQLRITDAQLAQLLGGGPTTTAVRWSSPLGQALLAEDPELRTEGFYYSASLPITEFGPDNKNFGIVATSLTDATTYFATSFLHTLVPHAMVSKTSSELGATADFATVTPPFNVDTTTTISLIGKALTPNAGKGFALLDAGSAASMWGGLADFALQAPSSIGSGSPVFVAPTAASMDAATTEMVPQDDGDAPAQRRRDPGERRAALPAHVHRVRHRPGAAAHDPHMHAADIVPKGPHVVAGLHHGTRPVPAPGGPGAPDPVPPGSGAGRHRRGGLGQGHGDLCCREDRDDLAGRLHRRRLHSAGRHGFRHHGLRRHVRFGHRHRHRHRHRHLRGRHVRVGHRRRRRRHRGQGRRCVSTGPGSAKGHPRGHAVPATLAGFNRAEEPGWLLPALGVLVLVLLLPGLAFLMSGRPLRPEVAGDGGAPGTAGPPDGEGPVAGREDG